MVLKNRLLSALFFFDDGVANQLNVGGSSPPWLAGTGRAGMHAPWHSSTRLGWSPMALAEGQAIQNHSPSTILEGHSRQDWTVFSVLPWQNLRRHGTSTAGRAHQKTESPAEGAGEGAMPRRFDAPGGSQAQYHGQDRVLDEARRGVPKPKTRRTERELSMRKRTKRKGGSHEE